MDYKKNQSQLLLYIQQLNLFCCDLVLFLDTHPQDSAALEAYAKYLHLKKEAINEYENCYGPLSLDSGTCSQVSSWLWVEQPWPWEIKKGGCR